MFASYHVIQEIEIALLQDLCLNTVRIQNVCSRPISQFIRCQYCFLKISCSIQAHNLANKHSLHLTQNLIRDRLHSLLRLCIKPDCILGIA